MITTDQAPYNAASLYMGKTFLYAYILLYSSPNCTTSPVAIPEHYTILVTSCDVTLPPTIMVCTPLWPSDTPEVPYYTGYIVSIMPVSVAVLCIWCTRQNVWGWKLLQISWYFTQLQSYSHKSWPCPLIILVYKHATTKVFQQISFYTLTVKVFPLKCFATYGIWCAHVCTCKYVTAYAKKMHPIKDV